MNGIHVFVFCCAEYKDLAGYCIESIKKYVTDNILSVNLVSNLNIDVASTNLILDQDFWKTLDPEWNYRMLYNANWTRQQIFKLAVDQYVTGNVLIVDAEILFLKPTQWINHNKTVYYTSYSPKFEPYFDLNKKLVNLDKISKHSFIADTMVFSTSVLQSLRHDIETLHQRPWLEVINTFIIDESGYSLSEFELYGNYVLKKFPDIVDAVIDPTNHVIDLNNRQEYSLELLLDIIRRRTSNNFISVNIDTHSYTNHNNSMSGTSWLSFYEQIRDPAWPSCESESDFDKLPKQIQKECIEIFGYVKKI